MLGCCRVKGSFLDRDDKKKYTSLDVKAGRRDYADEYIDDYAAVSSFNPLKCSGVRWFHFKVFSVPCHPGLTYIFNF